MKPLTIGALAKQTGIKLETVRFYEKRGLLPTPPRSNSGYRQYPADAAQRLRFIKRAQELGFTLREIAELLALRASPGTKSVQVRKATETKIADIEAKIRTLESMKHTLQRLTNLCSGCCPLSECPILESLDGEHE